MMLPCNTNVELTPAFFSEEVRTTTLDQLECNNYALIEGKNLPIPEYLQKPFNSLANAFEDLASDTNNPRNRFELVRGLDQGIFQISPENQASHHPQSLIQFEDIDLHQNQFLITLIESTSALLPRDKDKEKSCRDVRVSLSRHNESCSKLLLHQDYDVNFQLNEKSKKTSASKWVVQYNIHRSEKGISGGEILIANSKKEVIETKLLSERLDAYIVNNRKFFHGANPIKISTEDAARDVLIMEFRT